MSSKVPYIVLERNKLWVPRTKSWSNSYPGFKTDFIKAANPVQQRLKSAHTERNRYKRLFFLKTEKICTLVIWQMFCRNCTLHVTFRINTYYYHMRGYALNNSRNNTAQLDHIIFTNPVSRRFQLKLVECSMRTKFSLFSLHT